MIEVKVSYHPDHGTAMEKTRFWAPLALSPEEKRDVHDPIEMQRLAGELPIERAASRFIVSTDPDEHVEKIARYIELGFRHLVFHDPGADQAEFLRSYGTEILPLLRARFACPPSTAHNSCRLSAMPPHSPAEPDATDRTSVL